MSHKTLRPRGSTFRPDSARFRARARAVTPLSVEPLETRRLLAASIRQMPLPTATGGGPIDLVCDNAGDLFGVANGDAATDDGNPTIFEIAAGTSTPVVLAGFHPPTQGVPGSLAVDSAGNLFGEAQITGAGERAARNYVFEIAAHTGKFSELASFSGNDSVSGLVADSAGDVFGLTYTGALFEIGAGTTGPTTLSELSQNPADAAFVGLARDAAGNLFAEEEGGIFEFVPGTRAASKISNLPDSALFGYGTFICDAAGDLYLSYGDGGLVEITAGSHKAVGLPAPEGLSSITLDGAGDIYGEVLGFQPDINEFPTGDGAIVEISATTHAISTLISFNGSNGGYPSGPLVASPSGILYGTTTDIIQQPPATLAGSPYGSVFAITGAGFVTAPPTVQTEPADTIGIASHSTSISIAEGGYPYPAVQWQQSTDGGRTFADMTGNASAATTELRLPALSAGQSGTEYRAVLTSPLGNATSNSATLTVVAPVTLLSPAHASPNVVVSTSTLLTALGTTPGGQSGLTYKWSVVASPPGAPKPTLSANGSAIARRVVATFGKVGYYRFRCTISDGKGDTLPSDVSVRVQQIATSFRLTPHDQTISTSQNLTFHATVLDQFGRPLRTQPAATYSIASGPGTINPTTGLFWSSTAGTALIQADDDDLSGTAGLDVIT